MLPIPGFPNYFVTVNPFTLYNARSQNTQTGKARPAGRYEYTLYDSKGNLRTLSRTRILALCFHGPPPKGYHAHYYGGRYAPETVVWRSPGEAARLRQQQLTEWQRLDLTERFWRGETITSLAKRYRIAQRTVYYYIQRTRTIKARHLCET